ncbi:P-loop NTPase fold protein [Aquabacterium sp.]|uniref:KAP family P-loop NTPase fold protein n=1 Tax=Aquabacterium sp. TaxID=1872578 RepID=UPI0035C6816B
MAAPSPSIHHDRPLHGVDALSQDKLSRRSFAESAVSALRHVTSQSGLVLSVEGEWGSGKTSVLSLMEALLADRSVFPKEPVVVHFNPWLVGDRDALLKQFLGAIASKLELTDNAGVGQRVAKELKAYSKVFDVLKLIPGAEPWATIVKAVSDVVVKVGEAVGAVSDQQALDLQGRKNLVADALRDYARPIIVFIDDIDRLFPAEVFEMVRIVKAVGDLPNVGYVLAWDSAYVSAALQSAKVPKAETYLDKIVQVRLPLPKLSTSARNRLVDEAINALGPDALQWHFKDDEQRLSSLYFSGLSRLLEQPRDIMRVFNTVALLEPGLRGEVSFADIVALAALKVKAPEVFELLRVSPQYFVGRLPGDNSILTKSETIVAEGAEARKTALNACSAPDAVKQVVHFLFPRVAKADNGHAIDRVEAVEGHLAAPDRLLVALQHCISPMDVSLVAVRRYLLDPQARADIATALTADNCLDFLEAVEDTVRTTKGFGLADVEALCLELARLVEAEPFVLAGQRQGMLSLSPASACKSTIATVIESVPDANDKAIWTAIARDCLALSLAADVISGLYNEAMNERNDSGGDLTGHDVVEVIDVYAHNVLAAARDGRLCKIINAGYLMRRLADWKPQACGEVFAAITSVDPSLDEFVLSFLKGGRDSVKGLIYEPPEQPAKLAPYITLDELKARAQMRLLDTDMPYPLRAAWLVAFDGKKRYAIDGTEASW